MMFVLFRRVGISPVLSVSGVALFGSLDTTMETATYIGAVFDVLGTFFILICILLSLTSFPGSSLLSALALLTAIRTKEFAIMTAGSLTLLMICRLGTVLNVESLVTLVKRLWPQYLVTAINGIWYLKLGLLRGVIPSQNPYHLQITFRTVISSIAFYTSRIAQEHFSSHPLLIDGMIVLLIIGSFATSRRKLGFMTASYVLFILPVSCLPGIRSPFYLYAPQLFAIGACCLILDELNQRLMTPRNAHFLKISCSLACLCLALVSQASEYFQNSVSFTIRVREICMRSARDLSPMARMEAGAHVYVSYGSDMPWLLSIGTCEYLRLISGNHTGVCMLDNQRARIMAAFSSDPTPERYLIDYRDDGSLSIHKPGRAGINAVKPG